MGKETQFVDGLRVTDKESAEIVQMVLAGKVNKDLVKILQNHITEHYYHCTNEILAGLGQMYVADVRFKANIDKHAEGTAAFICEAITVYCRK